MTLSEGERSHSRTIAASYHFCICVLPTDRHLKMTRVARTKWESAALSRLSLTRVANVEKPRMLQYVCLDRYEGELSD